MAAVTDMAPDRGVHRERSHPPPKGWKGPPGSNLFSWKYELVKKNVKYDLLLYPVFFSAVDRLELCLCY